MSELRNNKIPENSFTEMSKARFNIRTLVITAAAINIKTGEIVKPIFNEELNIKRMARLWTDDYTIPNIYENPNPPFGKWKHTKNEFERLLQLNDQELLKDNDLLVFSASWKWDELQKKFDLIYPVVIPVLK